MLCRYLFVQILGAQTWALSLLSLQKAQGPGLCKLPKPPASRALCQAKRAPRAAFPSADAGRDWGQEEKGMTEDEMAGWHHRLNGREFEYGHPLDQCL